MQKRRGCKEQVDCFERQLKRGRKENNKGEESQRLSMHIPRHSVHSKLIIISRPWFAQSLLLESSCISGA